MTKANLCVIVFVTSLTLCIARPANIFAEVPSSFFKERKWVLHIDDKIPNSPSKEVQTIKNFQIFSNHHNLKQHQRTDFLKNYNLQQGQQSNFSSNHDFQKDQHSSIPPNYGYIPVDSTPYSTKMPDDPIYSPITDAPKDSTPRHLSINNDTLRYADSNDPIQNPVGNDVKQYPVDEDTQQYPANDDSQYYPVKDDTQQYPINNDTQQYPIDSDIQQFPDNGDSQQYPVDGEDQQHPADDNIYPQYPINSEISQYPDDEISQSQENVPQNPAVDDVPQYPNSEEYPQYPSETPLDDADDTEIVESAGLELEIPTYYEDYIDDYEKKTAKSGFQSLKETHVAKQAVDVENGGYVYRK